MRRSSCIPVVIANNSRLIPDGVSFLTEIRKYNVLCTDEHVLNEGHAIKTIEETMSIIHQENNLTKINTLEEIEILKAASSKYLLKNRS